MTTASQTAERGGHTGSPASREPLVVPAGWEPRAAPARDVQLDLLRGLAMAILVVNHLRLESALGHVTGSLLSAAEVLVAVSGVVVGMVFGRRWQTCGARATTLMLLRRSGKLYAASVVVVGLVGAATFVPGLATEALTISPNVVPATDLYAFAGPERLLAAVLVLEAGPWQFNILGFFIASLALAPSLLSALARGWWAPVLAASWALFALGRELQVDVLPSQSERPFPLLVWQVLFVNGLVLGWHRDAVAGFVRARRRTIACLVLVAAVVSVGVRLGGPLVVDAAVWARWEASHFDKGSLDPLRIVTMMSIAAALYLLLRRAPAWARAALHAVLLPLGRNSFYVFIVHVFLCLAVATFHAVARVELGLIGNSVVQIGCVALLCAMVRRRMLFRWIPR